MAPRLDMPALMRQRETITTQFNELEQFIDSCAETTPRSAIEVRLDALDTTYANYNKVQSKIEIQEGFTDELSHRLAFEFRFYDTKAKYKDFLRTNSLNDGNIGSTSAGTGDDNPLVKLPTIRLPVFDGKYENWLPFVDAFRSMVHENVRLSTIQKFYYLTSSLRDDAAQLIRNISITDANYSVAWQLLVNRYENIRLIACAHVRGILDIKALTKENVWELRSYVNTFTSNLNALTALNLDMPIHEVLLGQLFLDRLDPRSQREWEMRNTSQGFPTLKQLTDFLDQRCQALESLARSNLPDRSSRGDSSKFIPKVADKQSKINTYVSTQPTRCLYCSQTHALHKCLEFTNLSIDDRTKYIKDKQLCFNCLKPGHVMNQCVSGGCRMCKRKHHTLLHRTQTSKANDPPHSMSDTNNVSREQAESQEQANNQSSFSYCAVKHQRRSQVLLSTAVINVVDSQGRMQSCRALLDSASQANFITERCVQRLGLRKKGNLTPIIGINNGATDAKYSVDITMHSTYNRFAANITCAILPKITSNLPTSSINVKDWNLPHNMYFADPEFYRPRQVDILIGAELYLYMLGTNRMTRSADYPVLVETELGWILSGKISEAESLSETSVTCLVRTEDALHQQIARFWELEEVDCSPRMTTNEDCEEHFKATASRDHTGRFVVRLPFKLKPLQLGESFRQANIRLNHLEKRLERNPQLYQQYAEFLREYKQLGHMVRVPLQPGNKHQYFIPHHSVIKETSTTTRLRVVFDASAKTTSGLSLNETLMAGPTVQQDLFSIMVRFRTHAIVFTADIAKMYRQILVHKEDCKFQRILWRGSPDDAVTCYELKTVTYGTACAPFLATRCLQQLAIDEAERFPIASNILRTDFYVDDLVSGARDLQSALQIQADLIALLRTGGFNLRKWTSNCPDLLEVLPEELVESSALLQFDKENDIRILGVSWSPKADTFIITHKEFNTANSRTKREVASITASIFDPLGLISPVVISFKIFLQQLWQQKINWDDELPASLLQRWNKLIAQLPVIRDLPIRRQAVITNYTNLQIHGFCDASQQAYGACIYLRSVDKEGTIYVQLLCSKSRVAPLKPVSLPRLELCAAELLAKLLAKTRECLGLNVDATFLWSDSMICLAWIAGPSHKWKQFVANRVTKIQAITRNAVWNHVPTNQNPADLISRGATATNLSHSIWPSGPEWLSCDTDTWPRCKNTELDNVPESKLSVNLVTVTDRVRCDFHEILERFSNLSRLKRTLAYCNRFVHNCRHQVKLSGNLTATELEKAFTDCVRIVQQAYYPHEFQALENNLIISRQSQLLSLNPFVGRDKLLRVGGRLEHADIEYDRKHQIILPPNHHLTMLVIRNEHQRLFHAGLQTLMAAVRLRFWIPRGRQVVKRVIHKCVVCWRLKASSTQQLMGQLPKERVNESRPFLNSGVDYTGPLLLKSGSVRSRSVSKCYIALFICLATRAIHLELVTNLTSQCFIAALKRFMSRRGHVTNLFSDNGSTFKGANKELREMRRLFQSQEFNTDIENYASMSNFTWHFIPAHSPHFGGLWEAGIKTMKHHLRRIVGMTVLTYEELSTFLTQIEAILNSRPLCILSDDPSDPSYLCPGHFLIGGPIISFPEPDLSDEPLNRLTRWQRIQQMRQRIWSRWSHDFLNQMQQRKKWKTQQPNIEVGAVVLLKDENLHPLQWKLGRVTEVHKGTDGLVRVCTLHVGRSVTKRAVARVVPLPID